MRYPRLLVLAIGVVLCIAMAASAAPILMLQPATVNQGEISTVMLILLSGEEPYSGVNAKILLPKGVHLTGVQEGELVSSSNFRFDFHSETSDNSNWATVVAYSGGDIFGDDSGIVLELIIRADMDAPTGTYPISFSPDNTNPLINSKYALSNEGGFSSITPIVYGSTLTVSAGMDSDADGLPDSWEQQIVDANPDDNIENIEDVQPLDDFDYDGFSNLREYLAYSSPVDVGDISECWADFDGDGDVDGVDLAIISGEIGNMNCSQVNPCACDMDSDGDVDEIDVLFTAEDLGRTECDQE